MCEAEAGRGWDRWPSRGGPKEGQKEGQGEGQEEGGAWPSPEPGEVGGGLSRGHGARGRCRVRVGGRQERGLQGPPRERECGPGQGPREGTDPLLRLADVKIGDVTYGRVCGAVAAFPDPTRAPCIAHLAEGRRGNGRASVGPALHPLHPGPRLGGQRGGWVGGSGWGRVPAGQAHPRGIAGPLAPPAGRPAQSWPARRRLVGGAANSHLPSHTPKSFLQSWPLPASPAGSAEAAV